DTTADTLRAADSFREPPAIARSQEPAGVSRVADWLRAGGDAPADDPAVRAVLKAVREQQPEPAVLKLARAVDEHKLDAEIAAAVKQEAGIDEEYRAEADAARAAMTAASKADKAGT